MTRQETGFIMDILTTAYPRFYGGQDAPDPRKTVNLWAAMFAEDPARLVAAAVKALIATDVKGFPPSIGAVKEKMRQISEAPGMSEGEAWGMVSKAIQNGLYGSEKEFDRLPRIVQSIVGSPDQLREWAMMDASDVQTVVASNFQRAYRARAKHEAEFQALPPDVKRLAIELGGHLALKEGNG